MYDLTLMRVLACVTKDDRPAALRVVRTAVEEAELPPRDGIELILTLRQGSRDAVLEAIEKVRSVPAGTYRYVPSLENAFL